MEEMKRTWSRSYVAEALRKQGYTRPTSSARLRQRVLRVLQNNSRAATSLQHHAAHAVEFLHGERAPLVRQGDGQLKINYDKTTRRSEMLAKCSSPVPGDKAASDKIHRAVHDLGETCTRRRQEHTEQQGYRFRLFTTPR